MDYFDVYTNTFKMMKSVVQLAIDDIPGLIVENSGDRSERWYDLVYDGTIIGVVCSDYDCPFTFSVIQKVFYDLTPNPDQVEVSVDMTDPDSAAKLTAVIRTLVGLTPDIKKATERVYGNRPTIDEYIADPKKEIDEHKSPDS